MRLGTVWEGLTGNRPLRWQERLYRDHLRQERPLFFDRPSDGSWKNDGDGHLAYR